MPLILKKHLAPEGVVGVWHIEEDIEYFKERVELTDGEMKEWEPLKGKRKIEWLASRYLLHLLSERTTRGQLLKDEFGKPYLEDSEYAISLSHSHEKVAVIAAPKSVGIDIQVHVDKIERIGHKFVNSAEAEFIQNPKHYLQYLHIIWGAKECLFKSYGKKELKFKEHMNVSPFKFSGINPVQFTATLKKEDFKSDYNLHFEFIKNYYLVYAMEN